MYNTRNMSIMPTVQEAGWSNRAIIIFTTTWMIIATTALSLMQWEYMWIVLVVLTLIFLFACMYHAYKIKSAHEERLAREQQATERIRTISDLANHRETDYHLSTDLPPPYAAVVSAPTSSHVAITIDRSSGEKVEEPPSYSFVVASTNVQDQNTAVSNESNVPVAPTKKDGATGCATTSATDVRMGNG